MAKRGNPAKPSTCSLPASTREPTIYCQPRRLTRSLLPPTLKSLRLESLVTMKLMSNRRKDQVHLLDLISVGLIDATWPSRFPAELGERLQQLLDTPDG